MKTINLIFMLLLALPFTMQAQEKENLIPNGGFETFGTGMQSDVPLNWYIPQTTLFPRKEKNNKHQGDFALKLYANGGSFQPNNGDKIAVKSGHKYKLSFWYWMNLWNRHLIFSFYWYKGSQYVSKLVLEKPQDKINEFEKWTEKTHEIEIPEGVDAVTISIRLERESTSGAYLLLDDFRLTDEGGSSQSNVIAPSNLRINAFQRELECKWDNVAVEGYTWKVACNNQTWTTQTPSFTISGLTPATNYEVSVTAIDKDKNASTPIVMQKKTAKIMGKEDELRIPFLRSMPKDGYYKRKDNKMPLYFTDLYSQGATIDYMLDDQPIEPQNGWITFDKGDGDGEHVLKVTIKEADGKEWILEYNLSRID